jgi:hypothetical protein
MYLPPIAEFVKLVKVTDEEDADYRLQLVEQAAPVLYGVATNSEDERFSLAEKFERWRYQRLNKYGSMLSANDGRPIALLDLAARKILHGHSLHGYSSRPKAPRAFIRAPNVLIILIDEMGFGTSDVVCRVRGLTHLKPAWLTLQKSLCIGLMSVEIAKMLIELGVPKHSELEPDCFVVKGNGKPPRNCGLNAYRMRKTPFRIDRTTMLFPPPYGIGTRQRSSLSVGVSDEIAALFPVFRAVQAEGFCG